MTIRKHKFGGITNMPLLWVVVVGRTYCFWLSKSLTNKKELRQ
jgi:hypothetical protein